MIGETKRRPDRPFSYCEHFYSSSIMRGVLPLAVCKTVVQKRVGGWTRGSNPPLPIL